MYAAFGTDDGFMLVFAVLAAAFAFVAVIILVFGKETKGMSLKDVSE
jgi:putative MFS transporter